jgi:hypothetical protein
MLKTLAWANVGAHLVALVLAVVGMRPGSPLVDLAERRAYLAHFPIGWTAGWISWMLCTILLIAFIAVVARELTDRWSATVGLMLIIAGGAVDLFCDVIQIGALPMLAARDPFGEESFLLGERVAFMGGLIVANGMYSVAILLLTFALDGRAEMSRLVTPTGWGVFIFGMLMVWAGFVNSPRLAELSTGPTIVLFCVWALLVAYSLQPREKRA